METSLSFFCHLASEVFSLSNQDIRQDCGNFIEFFVSLQVHLKLNLVCIVLWLET